MSENIITTDLVALDVDAGAEKSEVIDFLVERLAADGRVHDTVAVNEAAMAREAQSATGLPGGIAIPHCRTEGVSAAGLSFARLAPAVDFGAKDGPADLVFLIAAPASGGSQHMKLLSSLARALVRPDFVTSLRNAKSADEVVALVDQAINPAPATSPAAAAVPAASGGAPAKAATRLVAITACPTGIAHTYMAADALKFAAERAGVDLVVETQGSSANTPTDPSVIRDADAVIFATDVGVKNRDRFAGKPVIASGVKRAINEPDVMIAEAVAAAGDPDASRVGGDTAAAATASTAGGDLGWGTRLRQVLLTGVSYMIPFVAAGGLLIALGFLLGGYKIALAPPGSADGTEAIGKTIALSNSLWNLPSGGLAQYLGAICFTLGGLAFSFLVPALAGYIAYAIADRPGLAPGFTAGAVAVFVGAGFIGGLVGGLLGGFVALWVGRIPLPAWARGLMPVVIIPLLATLATGGIMFLFLGRPLAWVNTSLTDWLNGLSGTSAIILGIILGLMMCFDLGGPVNKAAYAFAVQGLSSGDPAQLRIMAAVMAAGMVPPLALALATALRPRLFTEPERENGKAAWLLGASFISEGAIPFAAVDPLRVIPSMMAGGAVTGALVMAFDVTLRAPHGGIFVFFAMGNVFGFLLSLLVGMVISATLVLALKQMRVHHQARTEQQSEVTATTHTVAA
ncbi:PTS fructose transporter subunit IIABC [Williamsia sterculiae]|uniref:PTS system D-fructose-specific IIA component (F1P-forming), Frc family /PTS system D-fructose-specific IIB component (F1P-forming), Frc family /PTS system D-fructose-specific IIC component (F1P-for... n=1 Tax=Williamsia sterculiae TaxID=1344003 RepID=A0A1N7EE46_9NOCA|nr:fructose-specific PTS transporter subunit EIIC [Williamsia sterculiae]SIR86357.1 PTS system D-fructose-specific IIA component (F1P-forming), Frc family /PTS system D-fructose-specific IIB component (F1P-forming), Frc family /PTS system D-fructose-specific IIC component (F1P-forming), Frc family [Williamsia sterculiae]